MKFGDQGFQIFSTEVSGDLKASKFSPTDSIQKFRKSVLRRVNLMNFCIYSSSIGDLQISHRRRRANRISAFSRFMGRKSNSRPTVVSSASAAVTAHAHRTPRPPLDRARVPSHRGTASCWLNPCLHYPVVATARPTRGPRVRRPCSSPNPTPRVPPHRLSTCTR